MIEKEALTALILAGGKSSRMGRDKGLLLWDGLPFVQHILNAVQPLVTDTIIVANETAYEQFDAVIVEDLVADAGPVGGIYTGLNYSKTAYTIVLSCDMPLVDTVLLSYLLEHSQPTLLNVLKVEEQWHPFVALYHRDCLPIFEQGLKEQRLKLKQLLSAVSQHQINCPKEWNSKLSNINTPEELNQFYNAN